MNRYMKYVDLGVQTLCILLGGVFVVTKIIDSSPLPGTTGHFGFQYTAILFIHLALGFWQMLSSLISVVTMAPLSRLKAIHLYTALVYLLVFFPMWEEVKHPHWNEWIVFIPAWILATYYYSLSWIWVIRANARHGGFLPHLGF